MNVRALGLDELGPPVDVDDEPSPYRHSRNLTTNYPGTPVNSRVAHGTAIANRNEAVFLKTWIYLLTEPTVPSH